MATTIARRRSPWVYLLLGILVIVCAQFCFFLVSCDRVYKAQRAQTDQEPSQPVMSRQELEQQIQGKSEAEVLQALGQPDKTSQDSFDQYWHYSRRTEDPVTRKLDEDVQIVFEKGRVKAINY